MDIGCYYFPNYHPGDERNEQLHGKGWSEWEVVKRAVPRWNGHHQPKLPLWGYTDESNPKEMSRKIQAAQKAGIDYFIFDYYHYTDGTFLSDCLDKGFLPAVSGTNFKFALMWANHDWLDIHPCSRKERKLLYDGRVDAETFRKITDFIIEKYFKNPNYYCIDGKPYFSIYHIHELVAGLGGLEATEKALADFHRRVCAAGFPGLNLNAVVWGSGVLPGEDQCRAPETFVQKIGFDSMTSYVWIHHVAMPNQNEYPYTQLMEHYFEAWDKIEKANTLPYYPNVTVGWDSSPRTIASEVWDPSVGYPYMCTVSGNTPENFRIALEKTRKRMQTRGTPTFNINCWNEWTEGSMLEPEARYGTGYLDALEAVFKTELS